MIAQEIQLLEVLETEARSSRGIDFDGAANSKRVGICARSFRRRWRGDGRSGLRSRCALIAC